MVADDGVPGSGQLVREEVNAAVGNMFASLFGP